MNPLLLVAGAVAAYFLLRDRFSGVGSLGAEGGPAYSNTDGSPMFGSAPGFVSVGSGYVAGGAQSLGGGAPTPAGYQGYPDPSGSSAGAGSGNPVPGGVGTAPTPRTIIGVAGQPGVYGQIQTRTTVGGTYGPARTATAAEKAADCSAKGGVWDAASQICRAAAPTYLKPTTIANIYAAATAPAPTTVKTSSITSWLGK